MTELEELRLAYAECSRQRNDLLNKLKHQAQRTWVGLTTADRKEIERQSVYVEGAIRLTEAKLREKNT